MVRLCQTSLRLLLLAALGLLCAGCFSPGVKVVRGVLHGDLVWQGNVTVADDVIIEADSSLTILPGTKVRFLPPETGEGGLRSHPNFPGNELIVRGRLSAVGTPDKPIVFEASDPASPAGSWGAVNLEASPVAVFEYCIFRQADSAVHSRDSQVQIEQSVFENNLVGVRFHDSAILIEHNLLRHNDAAIRFHFGSPVICANDFADNAVNIFITAHPDGYRIENNTFGAPRDYHVVLGEEVPEEVSMPRNFWVSPAGVASDDLFYDGRRSPYLGRLVTDPVRRAPSGQAGLSWTP